MEAGGRRRQMITLGEIADQLSLSVQTAPHRLSNEVRGGCACDLLSAVMANAQPGDVWLTVQSHANIVAVAVMLDLAGIIVTGGVEVMPDTIQKAAQEEVPILTTSLSTFTVAGRLAALGVSGSGHA